MPEHYETIKQDMNSFTTPGINPYLTNDMPNITIHASARGDAILTDKGDSKSLTGHVFLSVKTHNFQGSIGFSTGGGWNTPTDNVSFNDHNIYTNAATHTIGSNNHAFVTMVNKIVGTIKSYQSGAITPEPYNLLTNNCIKFVEKLIKDAGGTLLEDLGLTPDEVKDKLPAIGNKFHTPLLIDLTGDGINTISIEHNVKFDFDGDGHPINTGWAQKGNGFLVIDHNGNGIIDNSSELFGDKTPLPDGSISNDGFQSLSAFDDNADGRIDANDNVWGELLVWHDMNEDGVSEKNELINLSQLGIKSIDINFERLGKFDVAGNFHGDTSSVTWDNGKQTSITDVWFKTGHGLDIITEDIQTIGTTTHHGEWL